MARPEEVIGIDASRAVGRVRTGTENYSAQLIRALVKDPSNCTWRLYFNGKANILDLPAAAHIDIRDIPSQRLWTHLRLSRELLTNRVSGLFVPAHVVPLYHPPTVVTIHDLGYLHWPEAHPASQRRMLDITTRWSANVARHIIVPSQQTADDLVRFYKTPDQKISVVHHGIDPTMSASSDDSDESLRERYGLHRPFVLAVGTIQPRKNLGVLARAMSEVAKRHDLDLVVAGRKGWMHEEVEAELNQSGLGDRLKILDYIPSEDLPALYRAAEIFVQPSKFEGFGMPILEAMVCGTPVIAARGSSLDEIGGDATIRFDHGDVAALADHISSLLGDEKHRSERSQLGLAHAKKFTWEQTARKTRIILGDYLLK